MQETPYVHPMLLDIDMDADNIPQMAGSTASSSTALAPAPVDVEFVGMRSQPLVSNTWLEETDEGRAWVLSWLRYDY